MLVFFVGTMIAAVYPGPKMPEPEATPLTKTVPAPSASPSAEDLAREQRSKEEWDTYRDKQKLYERNVSIISLIAAVLFLIISLTFATKIHVISDGILLGSVFTLFYSIIRGFGSESESYRLIAVTIGLFIALILGYIKFIKPQEESN